MANKLIDQSSIGRSNSNEETTMPDEKHSAVPKRCWLYKQNDARLFVGEDITSARRDGWKDELSPRDTTDEPEVVTPKRKARFGSKK